MMMVWWCRDDTKWNNIYNDESETEQEKENEVGPFIVFTKYLPIWNFEYWLFDESYDFSSFTQCVYRHGLHGV